MIVVVGAGSLAIHAAPVHAASLTTIFTTPGETAYPIPAGTISLQVTVVGAAGAATSVTGGLPLGAPGEGATVTATLTPPVGVTTLYAEVAGAGGGGPSQSGGTGGDESALQTCSVTAPGCTDTADPSTDPRLVVAGGGGGGGENAALGGGLGGNGGSAGAFSTVSGPAAGGAGVDSGNGVAGAGAGLSNDAGTGAAGAGGPSCGVAAQGGLGSPGIGGAGGFPPGPLNSTGGGGGAGWVGGSGGGGSDCGIPSTFTGSGGGGGAGASFYEASATGASVSMAGSTAAEVIITATFSASPTLVTTPNPSSVTLTTTPVTLKDSAVLSGGNSPTGTITFTLTSPASTAVDTETVTVSGNGDYTTPVGYSTPTTGTATGTYTWTASYSGDTNNNGAADQGGTAEQATVNPAAATLTTTLSANPVTAGQLVSDGATLVSASANAGGTLDYRYYASTGACQVETSAFPGTAPSGGTDVGSVTVSAGSVPSSSLVPFSNAGTYYWAVFYSGDPNNQAAVSGCATEQLVVGQATPALTTTASPIATEVGGAPLQDSATLANAASLTGSASITFNLYGPGDTQCTASLYTTTVSGITVIGTYHTTSGNITSGFASYGVGTYNWTASFSGDNNNAPVSTACGADPVTTVPAAQAVDDSGSITVLEAVSPPTVLSSTTAAGNLLSNDRNLGTDPASITSISDAKSPTGVSPGVNGVITIDGTFGTLTTSTASSGGHSAGAYAYSLDPGVVPACLGASAVDVFQYTLTDAYGSTSTANLTVTLSCAAQPALTGGTVAEYHLSNVPGTLILADQVTLSGGYNPTGTVTFTLYGPSHSVVDTETTSTTGNGSYSTPTGYTLPTSGTVTGVYQWEASYSGDANNNNVSDPSAGSDTIDPASPSLTTTPSATSAGFGTAAILKDNAAVSGGYYPAGSITFTLVGPGGANVDTEVVSVSGNGSYTTPTGYTLPTTNATTVTGTYQWNATYTSASTNNNNVSDNGATNEQVVVSPASTALTHNSPTQVAINSSFTPTATLSSAAAACYQNQPVTFSLSANPLTGAPGTYTLVTVPATIATSAGGVAAATVSTAKWLDRVYTINANYAGTSNCVSSASSMVPIAVTAPGLAAFGAGRYVVPNLGTTSFSLAVRLAAHSKTVYVGGLDVATQGQWWFQANVTSDGITSPTQALLVGTGTLYWWNTTLNYRHGGWALAGSNLTYQATVNAATKTTPASFGIQIAYTRSGSQPMVLPNSPPETLSSGSTLIF